MTNAESIHYADLRPLFLPRSLAVVGASEKPGPGSMVLVNARPSGFTGPVYAVNPRYSQVHGHPCFPRLSELPEVPECVAVAVPSALVPGVVREAAEVGARSVVVYGSGFAEIGPDGQALQRELQAIAARYDLPVCGPNCLGPINLQAGYAAYSAPLPEILPRGRVGAVVQSGSVCIGLLNSGRGVGFSHLVSSGNEAVTECADYIRYFVGDPNTDVIVAFVEGFRNPAKLADAARLAAEAHKPIIVVKVGRSELSRRAVQAHTGALAGSDAVHDAFFRRHGIIRVHDLDEMLETAQLFLSSRLPRGPGVGLITVSGGQVGLVTDLAEEEGIVFPELAAETLAQVKSQLPAFSNVGNPLDAWGNGDLAGAYPRCLEAVARDPAVDLVAVCQDAPAGLGKRQAATYQHVARAAAGIARSSSQTGGVLRQHQQRVRAGHPRHSERRRRGPASGNSREPAGH